MKYLIPFLAIFLVLGSLFSSCEREIEDIDLDYGYQYFPLETGKWIVYDVDSIVYDESSNIVYQHSYQLRETVADTILDASGAVVYRIERHIREADSLDWEIEAVWTAKKDDRNAERVEDNLRFVKMVFPIKDELTWDGNLYIDNSLIVTITGESIEIFKNWTSKVLSVGSNTVLNGENYSDVLSISHADDENLIEKRYVVERYAAGIGLIYKELQILDTQCGGNLGDCEGMTWEEKAEKGFILRLTIQDHN